MKTFEKLPENEPSTPLLDSLEKLDALKDFSSSDLSLLADEIREFLLYSTKHSGGHFGAGLGVVELTIALHHVFNTPKDKIVWDVGHQAYPHKILTGRKGKMLSMRKKMACILFLLETKVNLMLLGLVTLAPQLELL